MLSPLYLEPLKEVNTMTTIAIKPSRPITLIRQLTNGLTDDGYAVALHALKAYVTTILEMSHTNCTCKPGVQTRLRERALEVADATGGRATTELLRGIQDHPQAMLRALNQPTVQRTPRKVAA